MQQWFFGLEYSAKFLIIKNQNCLSSNKTYSHKSNAMTQVHPIPTLPSIPIVGPLYPLLWKGSSSKSKPKYSNAQIYNLLFLFTCRIWKAIYFLGFKIWLHISIISFGKKFCRFKWTKVVTGDILYICIEMKLRQTSNGGVYKSKINKAQIKEITSIHQNQDIC